MRPDRQAQDWNELAQLDPYWVILTAADKRYGGWDIDEFFAIGNVGVGGMTDRFERLGHPERRERALDFGYGLGRITRALAEHFDEAVGVDISEDMVRRARDLNADVPGATFVVNVANDLPTSTTPASISCSLRWCSSDRTQRRRRLYGGLRRLGVGAPFLYRRLRLAPIAMSFSPEPEIVRLIESAGARVLEVDTVAAEAGIRSSTYYATR